LVKHHTNSRCGSNVTEYYVLEGSHKIWALVQNLKTYYYNRQQWFEIVYDLYHIMLLLIGIIYLVWFIIGTNCFFLISILEIPLNNYLYVCTGAVDQKKYVDYKNSPKIKSSKSNCSRRRGKHKLHQWVKIRNPNLFYLVLIDMFFFS